MIKPILFSLGLSLLTLNATVSAEDNAATSAEDSVVLYVDINNDNAEKMADLLDGVGLAKAQAIVEYREQYGPFIGPEDLLNVRGIGPATLEKNRSRIQVGMTD
ncbi:ComEA family DNA-binding protein [Saccharospirillum mangrovi]|uniref:ComEA family DNA-binding protein n=1 Tax=Saccharospirillum mangrovi TaxID=2161747 RepID=UPI000D3C9E8F|nr:helix-hairpin-helix domain-containing protein [Saccharospirillum mangrovi]